MKCIVFCDNSLRELINFREDVIDSYAELGYKVYLISPKNREYTPKYSNITHIPIKLYRSSMNPLRDFLYLLTLVRIYIKLNPDFIFHYTVKPNIYGSFAAWITRIPSAAMIAGLGFLFSEKNLKARLGRFMYKLAMKIPKIIFVLNKMNKDLLISKGLAKPSQIIFLRGGEGINLEKFY